MGGCCNSIPMEDDLESDKPPSPQFQIHHNELTNEGIAGDGVWPFIVFFFSDLQTATKNFSSDEIVSVNGEESSNVVYKGHLQNNLGFVAIKKFKNLAWLDLDYFREEAQRVGELRHKRVVKLIGYCSDENERLLVAEFMPNDNLAKRLFHQKSETMEWSMRLRVAYCVAEALDYCRTAGFESYNNLSAYTVLFHEDGDACLSCFGLMKEETKDVQRTTGSLNSESVTYRFGIVLLNLLSGKQIPSSHALEMINGKTFVELMDPNLNGRFSDEEATVVFQLASRCLRYEDRESLNTKDLVETLQALQTQTEVPSFEMPPKKKQKENEKSESTSQVSPLGQACLRMDLNAIHEILVMAKYEDDKDVSEYSFEDWLPEANDIESVGKLADTAFEEKNFETAIECYTQIIEAKNVVFPNVYARRCLSYLFRDQLEAAHIDMLQAQNVFPDWPIGFYLMSIILAKADMPNESAEDFKKATLLEQNRLNHFG